MSKPRSDSKLLSLPEEQQAKLAEWLLSGMPYHAAQELVEKEFGVRAGLTAFSGFWSAVCSSALIARRARAVNLSTEVAQEARKHPGQFDQATVDALQQKAFELAVSPQADPRDVKSLFMLVLKSKDQQLDQEQLKLDRDKFQFDAAEAALKNAAELKVIAADSGLSESEKIDKARQQLFGMVAE